MFGTNSIQRTYLAVRGGICVTPVLGSRSYDVLSAIEPSPLQAGDELPIGDHTDHYPELDQAPVAAITGPSAAQRRHHPRRRRGDR